MKDDWSVPMGQTLVCCDSKQHIRHGAIGTFHGLIGVTLVIKNPEDFKKQFDNILGNFFKGAKLARKRKIYKSSAIGSLFPGNRDRILKAYGQLARSLIKLPEVDINFYYLTLDLGELRARVAGADPEKSKELESQGVDAKLVNVYGEKGREGVRLESVTDFFAKVKEYFPIVCSWKLCSYLNAWDVQIVLDGCKGEKSYAWEELVENCADFTIAFNSGLYNPFLAACDILVKWVDETLREHGLPLNQNALARVLTEWKGVTVDLNTAHVHIVHLSNRDLQDIQPLSKEKIDAFEHLHARHPIFFIFREEATEKQRVEIENSPRMNKIADLIYDNNGSLLWWDGKLHAPIIGEGDVAIVFGENSLKEAEFLAKQGGYPIKIVRAETI
jgi:hypothetical protein